MPFTTNTVLKVSNAFKKSEDGEIWLTSGLWLYSKLNHILNHSVCKHVSFPVLPGFIFPCKCTSLPDQTAAWIIWLSKLLLPCGAKPAVLMWPWAGLECNTQWHGQTMAHCQSYKAEFFPLNGKDILRLLLMGYIEYHLIKFVNKHRCSVNIKLSPLHSLYFRELLPFFLVLLLWREWNLVSKF